jgi:hypothetical protein
MQRIQPGSRAHRGDERSPEPRALLRFRSGKPLVEVTNCESELRCSGVVVHYLKSVPHRSPVLRSVRLPADASFCAALGEHGKPRTGNLCWTGQSPIRGSFHGRAESR